MTRPVLRTRTGRSVTGERLRRDRVDSLVVVAEYGFADVDRLQVSMTRDRDDAGLDPRAARITSSPGRYTVGMRNHGPGRYTVTVAGSGMPAGNRSASVSLTVGGLDRDGRRDADASTPDGDPDPGADGDRDGALVAAAALRRA